MPLKKKTRQVNKKIDTTTLFPMMQKKKGIDWIGNCRYISGANFSPVNFALRGGSRNEIDGDSMCLTSCLSFPNGKTRKVNIKGKIG